MLCALALVAAGQALLLPRWPRAEELQEQPFSQALRRGGWNARQQPAAAPERGSERALSSRLQWRLSGIGELSLVQAAVRQRDSFQTAFLGRDHAELALSQRRRDQPIPGSDAGLIQGRQALQTCLVRQPDGPAIAASRGLDLSAAADRRVRGRLATLRGVLGLQPSRDFSCLLVTLRSDSSRPLPGGLWQRLLPVLQATLEEIPEGSGRAAQHSIEPPHCPEGTLNGRQDRRQGCPLQRALAKQLPSADGLRSVLGHRLEP